MSDNPFSSPQSEDRPVDPAAIDWRRYVPLRAQGRLRLADIDDIPPFGTRPVAGEKEKQSTPITSWIAAVLGAGLLVLAIVSLIDGGRLGDLPGRSAAPYIVIFACVVGGLWLSFKITTRKWRRELELAERDGVGAFVHREYVFTEEGFVESSEHWKTTNDWARFSEIGYTKDALALGVPSDFCTLLPRHFFASEEEWLAVIALAEERIEGGSA